MSSILKALKKLEQEAVENAGVPLPMGAGKQYRKKNILVPGLVVFSLCVLIFVSVTIFVRKHAVPEVGKTVLEDKKSVPALKIPAAIIPENNAERGEQNKDQKGLSSPDSKVPGAGPVLAGKGPRAPQKENVPLPDEHKNDLPVPTPGKIQTEKPITPVMSVPDALSENKPPLMQNPKPADVIQPDAGTGKTSASASTDNRLAAKSVEKTASPVAVINDPSLELQAISWSANAEKRMAIINGKICREKDHVGEYVIVAINSGDVVLSKGSVTGKLVFKIR